MFFDEKYRDVYESYKKSIDNAFNEWVRTNPTFKGYLANIQNNKNVWENANKAVEMAGEKMSSLLREMAEKEIPFQYLQQLTADEYRSLFNYSSQIGSMAQKITNEMADIHMSIKFPKIDDSRIDGLIEILTRDHDNNILLNTSEVFREGVGSNIGQNGINELVKYNSRIQNRAGFKTTMIRKSTGHCCEWCSKLIGVEYRRGEEPDDFWKFHDNCTCYIEYKVDKRIDIVSYKTRN